MKGLEAIIYHNGFNMAAVGIIIVFTALVSLSLIISQLHKLIALWDNRKAVAARLCGVFKDSGPAGEPSAAAELFDMGESARQFHILIQAMGEPFSLPELIRIAESFGIKHPWSTVSHLIANNLIIADHKGFFLWNHEAHNRLAKRSGR